jgi:hypothetical protein
MNRLNNGCPQIHTLEIIEGSARLEPHALKLLNNFEHLRFLKLFYTEELERVMEVFLSESAALEEIVLYGDMSSYDMDKWVAMVTYIEDLAEQFPCVKIELVDIYW